MADKAISELIGATQITPTDLLVMEQNGTAKSISGQVLINFLTSIADGHGGIQSIAKTGTNGLVDAYRITLADTATFDFTVTNGLGITGIAKTSAEGLVDTYTISYNDGTSDTITVTNGEKGEKGDAGYVHIRYASQEPTEESHSIGDLPDNWMGIYSGTSETAPSDWTQYRWYEIKGKTGDPGAPAELVSSAVEYQAGSSGTIIPSGEWSAEIPTVAQGKYLWTRTTQNYNTGDPLVSYSVARFGIDGAGSVSSVNGASPDPGGDVKLSPETIGALGLSGGAMTGDIDFGANLKGLKWTADDGTRFIAYTNPSINAFQIVRIGTDGMIRSCFKIASDGTPSFYVPLPATSLVRSPFQVAHEYNDALKNEIVECAMSYYRNADKLYYGNESIATSLDGNRKNPLGYYLDAEKTQFRFTALERGDDGNLYYIFTKNVYDPKITDKNVFLPLMATATGEEEISQKMAEARGNAANIQCQIDCSSFVQLVMEGIPFECSRYAKWMNEDASTIANERYYDWGYVWSESDIKKYYKNRDRLGAGYIAQYCLDHGCSFEIADWKKLQTGDLLFVKKTGVKAYTDTEDVSHVMIYLFPCTSGSSNEDDHWVMDVGARDETDIAAAPVSIKRVGVNYLNDTYQNVIFAGRLPMTCSRDLDPVNLISCTGPGMPAEITGSVLNPLVGYLNEKLEKDAFYTAVIEVETDEEYTTRNVGAWFCINFNGKHTCCRMRVEANGKSYFVFNFMQAVTGYEEEVGSLTVRSIADDNTATAATHVKTIIKGFSIYKGIFRRSMCLPPLHNPFGDATNSIVTDVNHLTVPGKHYVAAGTANLPPVTKFKNVGAIVYVLPIAGTAFHQVVGYNASNTGDTLYYRIGKGGTEASDYGSWYQIDTTLVEETT